MDNIEAIIGLIVSGCTALATILTLAINLYKSFKTIKEDKNWLKILDAIRDAAKVAEATGLSGADKKTMVINMVTEFCKSIGVNNVDLNQVSAYIDEIIDFSNTMQETKKLAEPLSEHVETEDLDGR